MQAGAHLVFYNCFVHDIGMCVYVHPQGSINTFVKYDCINQLNEFQLHYMALAIDVNGLCNKACHECLPKETKVTMYQSILYKR